jgi:anti-sigma regulatory factor (Ser/Thr protein kinase)
MNTLDTPRHDVRAHCSTGAVRVFRAEPEQAHDARHWVADFIGEHPCRDDAIEVVGELFNNAIKHGSPAPDATVTVFVRCLPTSRIYVSVTDQGRVDATAPAARHAGVDALDGRGLAIVEALSARWGSRPQGSGTRVFALIIRHSGGGKR